MHNLLGNDYAELLRVVRYVRQRWRLKVVMRGAIVILAAGFAAFAISVWGMDYFLYSPTAVLVFRLFTYLTLLALLVRYLVLPLAQRVTDERVALYIEEHEPSLQAAVVSAVEIGAAEEGQRASGQSLSPQLVQGLVLKAIEKCREIDYAHGIERGPLRSFSGGVAAVAGAGALAVLLSPAFLQHGALLLFLPWRGAALDNPYHITVSPGSQSVPRGADQEIRALLVGFDSERVELATKSGQQDWQRQSMNRSTHEAMEGDSPHDFMLLNLQHRTEYFVEANGIRSPIYRIEVTDLPYVERLDFEYRFPAYTGLAPERVEGGGDIAALRGTEVVVEVHPTFPVPGGRLRFEDGEEIVLETDERGLLMARLTVERESFYQVELLDAERTLHPSSPEYAIEVLDDQPPILRLKKPGRDTRANPIDEIFAQVEAEDDFGLDRLELLYSVNGSEEERVVLYGRRQGVAPKRQVSAGYTFFLEELDLEPGDFVSYYARTCDGNRGSSLQTTTSDIYFIEIRPFGQDYRQAEQAGMPGGGGGGLDNTLSLRQRQIIAATFRLIRDRREYSNKEYKENLATLALLQGRLREQVDTLVMRMQNRATLLGNDDFQKIIGFLEQASAEMEPAEEQLAAEKPREAMPPEQRALKFLQRSEAVFRDVRVSFDPNGGGGGGEAQRLAEDLADLFELELDKLRNQYETVQRGQRQATDNRIDEALQKLQELARRQQQENERARRRASRSQMGGGGSQNQQELIDEAEELARQLERLAREQRRPELQDSARRLQEAADAMKRSSTNRSGQSLADGVKALDRLREARRLLDKSRQVQLTEELEQIESRARRIGEMQERIRSQVSELGAAGGGERDERLDRITERKDQLAEEVASLEQQLDRTARQARGEQKEASRRLQGAADSIRENQLKEKIRYSKGVVRGRETSYARLFEEEIGADIEEMQERVAQARSAVGRSAEDEQQEALDRARELVQSMESLEARLRDQRPGEQGERSGEPQLGEAGQGEQEGDQQADSRQGERSGEQPGGERLAEGRQQEGGGQEGTQSGEQRGGDQEGDREASAAGGRQSGDGSEQGRDGFTQLGPSTRAGGFQPGIFRPEELRQFQRELDRRVAEGRELRDELRRQGLDVADLDDILRQMRQLNLRRINNDPLALERLRGGVVEGLRQFEYRLWRELEGGAETLHLSSSDEVPAGYREMVEEYFKNLSEGE